MAGTIVPIATLVAASMATPDERDKATAEILWFVTGLMEGLGVGHDEALEHVLFSALSVASLCSDPVVFRHSIRLAALLWTSQCGIRAVRDQYYILVVYAFCMTSPTQRRVYLGLLIEMLLRLDVQVELGECVCLHEFCAHECCGCIAQYNAIRAEVGKN